MPESVFPEKYRGSIFNAFTEAKRTGTNGEKAFGLGLSISRQIIEKHHGAIWFESEEGKGTTFFIRLPRFADSTLLTGHISDYRNGDRRLMEIVYNSRNKSLPFALIKAHSLPGTLMGVTQRTINR